MRYENASCAACGNTFTAADDVVVCPVCGAPHHRACWMKDGRCAMTEKHAEGFAWQFPAELQPKPEKTDIKQQDSENRPQLSNGEKIVPCPRCGSSNYENDTYCLRCGARLDGSDAARYTEEEAGGRIRYQPEHMNELRSSFEQYGGISPEAPVDGIPCAEYADYVGGSRPGKIIRKVSTMDRYGKRFSWLWSAFFFGPCWYFWRRMKKEGAMFSLLALFFAIALTFLQLDGPTINQYKQMGALARQYYRDATVAAQTDPGSYNMRQAMREFYEQINALDEKRVQEQQEELASERHTQALMRAVFQQTLFYCLIFGLPMFSGLLAIPQFRKKAKADILRARSFSGSMEEYRAALQRSGRTSVAGALLGMLVLALEFFCINYLPMLIVYVML